MHSFTVSVDDKICNHWQSSFTVDDLKAIYYKTFVDNDINVDANIITYGTKLIYMKSEEVDDSYIESMDEYIGANVVVSGKDDITPVLSRTRGHKRDINGNPVGH